MEYEPGLEEVLRSVVPWYLCMFIHAALASSALCEQAARMTSMDSATKNAGEIIENLTLMFNRQRQSIITQEITEIVSGANALQ
jgi:F-type H+-transporting ATPase subunit gamma